MAASERKNKITKYIIRTFATLLMIAAVVCSVLLMQHFLCIPGSYDDNRVLMLHKEPANTIDVLIIGSSATYADYSAAYAYDKYGFTSYPFAISGAPCTNWKPALRDALRTQSPKLVVIDVYGGSYEPEILRTRSSQTYTIMSHQPISMQKIETAKEVSAQVEQTSTASLVMPFLKFHYRVPSNLRNIKKRLAAESYGPSPLKGIETLARAQKFGKIDDSGFSDETIALDSQTEATIREFIEYCKNEDIDLMFVKYPLILRQKDPNEMDVNKRANSILEIAEESGCPALNMQKHFYDIGLDQKSDFYNHGHANLTGQKKITTYLCDFIQDNFDIGPSELDQSSRDEWDKSIVYYEALNKLTEAMIRQDKSKSIGESPLTIEYLDRIIAGEDPDTVATDYKESYPLSRARKDAKGAG